MTTKLEKDIEMPVVGWAKKHGFLTPKVRFSEAGWPDRLFISPIGHTIFIEFKRPPFRPDALQEYRLGKLRERGIPAYWVDSVIEGISILKAAVEPARLPEASDSVVAFPSRSGAISGSGTGENVNLSGSIEDLVQKGLDQASAHSSPASADVLSLAGGNPEVARILRSELQNPTRKGQGNVTPLFRTDPPNKP